ncbi:GDSL esterase/lipase, partial [Camellia lanceoleosa]
MGQLLGFDKFIQPFATARGWDILMGVNYGSGGAGIRDETGQQLQPIYPDQDATRLIQQYSQQPKGWYYNFYIIHFPFLLQILKIFFSLIKM